MIMNLRDVDICFKLYYTLSPQHLPLGGVPLRPEREEWHGPPQLPPLPRLHGPLVRGEEEPRTFTDCLHMMLWQWSTPLISVMPGMQILLFLMNLVNIACNFYLYRFLEEKRRNNTGAQQLKGNKANLNTSLFSPEGDGHEEGEDQEPAARQDWILWHHHFRGTLRLLASGLRPEGLQMELLHFGVPN